MVTLTFSMSIRLDTVKRMQAITKFSFFPRGLHLLLSITFTYSALMDEWLNLGVG
jgi:hypothetical protein